MPVAGVSKGEIKRNLKKSQNKNSFIGANASTTTFLPFKACMTTFENTIPYLE